MLNCGTCATPNTCGGGGTPNVCGCTGISCCTSSTNTDGDCITDCNEDNDSDPFTDKNVFNGMRVRQANQCSLRNVHEKILALSQRLLASESIRETGTSVAGLGLEKPAATLQLE